MRRVTDGELVHEKLGDRFEEALSLYDTMRRVEVLVDDFLGEDAVRGKKVLDVGCGLGYFSERLHALGAEVTACDIGPNLVERTSQRVGCEGQVADALALEDTFGTDAFDVVVSSECIEHTPEPRRAVEQMFSVLKPGGLLSLSTPNVVWWPVVWLATATRLRPFDGHENFSTWGSLERAARDSEAEVVRRFGLHLFPFQFRLHGLSRWCDAHLQVARHLMINLCVLARKKAAT